MRHHVPVMFLAKAFGSQMTLSSPSSTTIPISTSPTVSNAASTGPPLPIGWADLWTEETVFEAKTSASTIVTLPFTTRPGFSVSSGPSEGFDTKKYETGSKGVESVSTRPNAPENVMNSPLSVLTLRSGIILRPFSNGTTSSRIISTNSTGPGTSSNITGSIVSATRSIGFSETQVLSTPTSFNSTAQEHSSSTRMSPSTSRTFPPAGPISSPTSNVRPSSTTPSAPDVSVGLGGASGGASSSSTGSGGGNLISSTSHSLTSTITAPPTGFSAVTLSATSFTEDTWVTTTNSDHQTTLLPIIAKGGGIGVLLWDLPPIPDVLFNLPGIPKFHFPCIRIPGLAVGSCRSNPVPDEPSDTKPLENPKTPSDTQSNTPTSSFTASSPSSSKCRTTQTVSNCAVQCATATNSRPCSSYITTCSQTLSGCSVAGTTRTLPQSTSICTSCSSCFGPQTRVRDVPRSTISDFEQDTDDLESRVMAGPVPFDAHSHDRRGAKVRISEWGTGTAACALKTPASSKLTRPAWPAPTPDILMPEASGNLKARYSTISRWDRATRVGPCGIPTTTRLNANAFLAAPTYTNYPGNARPNNNDATLDHAYEKSWLKDFFMQLVATSTGTGKLSCVDLNRFFFPTAPATVNCPPRHLNIIQPVWDALAGTQNLYFVGMSQYLNGDSKGQFFPSADQPSFRQTYVNDPKYIVTSSSTAWQWHKPPPGSKLRSASGVITNMIGYFEPVLLGVLEMNSHPMFSLIDRTNNRIWAALETVDNQINTNYKNCFGGPNPAAWQTAFGSGGIAGAYRDYITNTILPQILVPPVYLTDLWRDTIKKSIQAAENLPDVKTDSKTGKSPGPHFAEWKALSNFAAAIDSEYLDASGNYKWEYTFTFAWDNINTKRDPGGSGSSRMDLACGLDSSDGPSTATAADGSNSPSVVGSASTFVSSLSGTQTGSGTSTGTSSPVSKSSSIHISTTPLPPRIAAPDVTVTTSATPDCVQGWQTYTMPAVASAPANAASQRFIIPQADHSGTNWEFYFLPRYLYDPKMTIESWTVGTSAAESPLASGKGGKDMNITWQAPLKANGTYVELQFIDPDPPLDDQLYGIVAKGNTFACMPDKCSGPPHVATSPDGVTCVRRPCSTDLDCYDGGPVTPKAACLLTTDGLAVPLWYDVTIVTNKFITDGGSSLKSEEGGCGDLLSWSVSQIDEKSDDGTWTATQAFSFTLPLTIKSGCVERAIHSAGGPDDLQCGSSISDWVF